MVLVTAIITSSVGKNAEKRCKTIPPSVNNRVSLGVALHAVNMVFCVSVGTQVKNHHKSRNYMDSRRVVPTQGGSEESKNLVG